MLSDFSQVTLFLVAELEPKSATPVFLPTAQSNIYMPSTTFLSVIDTLYTVYAQWYLKLFCNSKF